MTRQQLLEQLELFVQTKRQDIIEDLKTLVRIRSVSQLETDGFPFGAGCAKALDTAIEMTKEKGFESINHGYRYGTAYYNGYEKDKGLIGIFSHLDVVDEGKGWIHDPYDPTEKDGFIIGRGAGDNKSGAIIGMYTFLALRELNIPLQSNVMLFFGCNEESGMKDIEAYVKEQPMPDYSMVPDLFFPVCYGEKGNLKTTLLPKEGFRQIESFVAGDADNKVPDEAVVVLKYQLALFEELVSKTKTQERIAVERNEDSIVITATGIGGHASLVQGTINAIMLLAKFLEQINLLDSYDRELCKYISDFSGDTTGKSLGIDWEDEPSGALVATMTRIKTDGSMPIVLINIRYPVTDYRERVEKDLSICLVKKGWHIQEVYNNTPLYIPKDSPYVQTLCNIYQEVVGESKEPYVIDGGTYARKLNNAVGFGGGNGVRATFLPTGHGGVHQPDEARNIQGILEAIKVYVMSVIALNDIIHTERGKRYEE